MAKTRARTRFTPKLISVAVAACFATSAAFANPTGPAVVNGQASFHQQGNLLQVTNSPSAIIHWQSFSIGAAEITRFLQQSASSAVLNRVITQNPSSILGALQSNGRVFLVNPNGILFGAGAQIDVAGLVASTLNLSNADFLAGRLRFTEVPGAGSLVNQGTINAASGGQVYLVGPSVTNSGIIASPKGEVILAAGNSVELVNPGTPNLRVEISAPDNEARNLGQIVADAGRVGIYAGLISHSGTIRADSAVATEDGRILLAATKNATLEAGSTLSVNGPSGGSVTVQSGDTTLVSGSIEAKGAGSPPSEGGVAQSAGVVGKGGTVHILGNLVGLIDNASIDASGNTGGGTVLVGGDFQGKNPEVQNAFRTYVGPNATIAADAVTNGDGGKVIVWSDDATRFYGRIGARGGADGGNGGFVETSGKQVLEFAGTVDTLAPRGAAGTLLLDPQFLEVTDTGAVAYDPGVNNLFANNPGATTKILASGAGSVSAQASNVVLQANTDVTFTDPVNIAAAGVSLTAQAGRSVLVDANISTTNGDITLSANDPGATLADRLAGPGGITMAPGTTINAGMGKATLRVGIGPGAGTQSGNIVVENIIATRIELQQNGRTAGTSNIRRASPSSLLQGTNILLEVDHGGTAAGGSIGTALEPMRVAVSNLEAHTHEASAGIFIDSPTQGLTIGGVPFFGGAVKGVQNVTSGDISITANGNLITQTPTALPAGCGPTGETGGPVCTGGSTVALTSNNGSVSLGNIVSAAGANGEVRLVSRFGISQGAAAPVTANTLLADGGEGSVQMGLADNMVKFLAGRATGEFRFKNGQSLEIGTVALVNGITVVGGSPASVEINVTSGNLTVNKNISATATGSSNSASVALTASAGSITVNNSTISAKGASGTPMALLDAGGSATVTLDAGTGITLNSSTVRATGGNGTCCGGSAEVSLNGGAGGITVTGATATISATGGDGGEGFGGSATVTLNAAGNISLASTVSAIGGAGSSSQGSASVGITSNNGNITTGAQIIADGGGEGGVNIDLNAPMGFIASTGGFLKAIDNSGGDPQITLMAKNGIGTLANPIRIFDDQPDVVATNSTSGAIVLSQVSGNVAIEDSDFINNIVNNAPGGLIAGIAESGNIVVTSSIDKPNNSLMLNSGGGDLIISAASPPVTVTAQNVTLTGNNVNVGSALASGSTSVEATGTMTVNAGGNVNVTGGSVPDAFARIVGNDVNVTAGGSVNLTAGVNSTAYAQIEALSASSINLTFPNLSSGGFFVNGQEGVTFDSATDTGFIVAGDPVTGLPFPGFNVTYGRVGAPPTFIDQVVASTNQQVETLTGGLPGGEGETGVGTPEEEKKKGLPICGK